MTALAAFGLGYCASALAEALRGEGWVVAGTARSSPRIAALAARGFDARPFDGTAPLADIAALLDGVDGVLDSIPPAPGCVSPPLHWHGGDLLRLEEVRWIGYLSSTGVYGDHGGAWLDENAPLRPSLPRARRRLEAERAWLAMHERYGLPVHVFRLAGIYGPGRGVLEKVRTGRARRIVKPGQVFSRIHVEDVVSILRASMARPRPGAVYNLCDDEPQPPERVLDHACRLLGVAPPETVPWERAGLSEAARGFWTDNKRVRNDLVKRELGVVLRYPSYREGLAAEAARLTAGGGDSASAASATTSPRVRPSLSRSVSRERR